MSDLPDVRERVIKAEVKLDHVERKVDDISKKVNDMHDILMQARGARWVLFAIAAGVGGLASVVVKVFTLKIGSP